MKQKTEKNIFINVFNMQREKDEKKNKWIKWATLSFLCFLASIIWAKFFKGEKFVFCMIFIGCNVLLWPIVYSKINEWLIDLINFIKKSSKSNKNKIEEIYNEYYKRISLCNIEMKMLLIAIVLCINAWVWMQGNIFDSLIISIIGYFGFFILTLIAGYSVVLLVSVNISMVKIVNECNCYKVPYHPNYAEFIRKILEINSRITKIITLIYIFLWIGLIRGPFAELNIWVYIIMFGIGLMPLMYTFYNVELKKIIIRASLSEDIRYFEEKHLMPLYNKMMKKPSNECLEKYRKLAEFRDELINSKKKQNFNLKLDLIISTLTALFPIAWQVFCWITANQK